MAFTRLEKATIEEMKTVGYWSALGGVEVKSVEHGTEDYVICVANSWYGHHTYHKLRVYYLPSTSRPYISIDNHRLYLDQCIRNP